MKNPLTISTFHIELKKLCRQFDFARFALRVIPKSRKEAFFKDERERELSHWESMLSGAEETKALYEKAGVDFDKFAERIRKSAKYGSGKELGPRNRRTYEEGIEDGLNQSELLLLIAHLETFLKELHRQLLRADPKAVFGKRADNGKPVQVKQIFERGFDNFLLGLIEKEVRKQDRESIGLRSEYFAKFFGFPLGDSKTIERLTDLFEVRNNISHHILDADKIRIPNDADIKEARQLFTRVASSVWAAAWNKYPTFFR